MPSSPPLRVCFVVLSWLLVVATAPLGARHADQAEVPAQTGAVVAANPLAVAAGAEILRHGGSAVDAAVAIQAMLGLVEPQSSGIGGGAFMLYYDAHTATVFAISGREKAPAGAVPDMFLDAQGRPLSYLQAVRTGRSTGVPGAVALLAEAHTRFGALPWKALFTPAIRAAREGFSVPARLAGFLGPAAPLPLTPQVRAFFSRPDGSTLQQGDVFRNLPYARTLQRLAVEGPRALYTGSIAQQIVARTHEEPGAGTMTLQDLADYRAEWGQPLCRPYRERSVCVPPPPSSGLNLLQLLMMLDDTDIAQRGPQDPQAWFLFAQASRLMYADRDRYVADPAFIPVPVEQLLDSGYLAARAQLIGQQAGPAPPPGQLPGYARAADRTNEAAGTSHFVVLDGAGNVVSMTTTVESIFGSGRMVEGFVLNNQLTDFSYVPADQRGPVANRVQGGKRPRSSMSPIIVLDRDRHFVAALGSPGGSSILPYNAKTTVGILAWHLSMQQAIELPNLIAHGDHFEGEVERFAAGVVAGLQQRGIDLGTGRSENSGLHGVQRLPDGSLDAGADSRREGRVQLVPPAELHVGTRARGAAR